MINLKFIYLRAQSRFSAWLFWTLIWIALGILFSSVFQSLSDSAQDVEKAYGSLPPAVLKSFNIESGYLTQVERFLSGEFLTIYTLIGAVFAFFQGLNEVGGKIDDRSISNFLTKNISRSSYYILQLVANLIFLLTSNALVWTSIYWSFRFFTSGVDIPVDYFVNGIISTSVLFVCISGFGQLLGIILPKSPAQYSGISFLVFSWFLNSLSNIQGYPEWLKPVSAFYYLNIPKLRDELSLDFTRINVLILVFIVCIVVGLIIFRKKDLYL